MEIKAVWDQANQTIALTDPLGKKIPVNGDDKVHIGHYTLPEQVKGLLQTVSRFRVIETIKLNERTTVFNLHCPTV